MMPRLLTCALAGFLTHVITYDITHAPGFPELGRYGVGVMLLAVAVWIVTGDEDTALRFLGVATITGAGVVAGKIARAMCEGRAT